MFGFTIEHGENRLYIICRIKRLPRHTTTFFANCNISHSVHFIMDEVFILFVVGNEIIIFVIKGQCHRIGAIILAIFTIYLFSFDIVIIISKCDFSGWSNGIMKCIHIIKDTLIHTLDSIIDVNLTWKPSRLRFACKTFQLFNQWFAFLFGNKSWRLYTINQNFQFSHFKNSGS